MKTINEYLRKNLGIFRKALVCSDGFTISIQASAGHYCRPREDLCMNYEAVEAGFPSAEDDILEEYKDDPNRPQTENVFPFVPVSVIDSLIEKHGGIAS